MKYYVCLILLGDVSRDARTINIARTIARSGKKACIISTKEEMSLSEVQERSLSEVEMTIIDNIDFFKIKLAPNQRLWKKF